MKESVLVVGGAGYIGSHTAKFLLKEGYTPVILDNLSTGHREAARRSTQNGLFYEGDYSNSELVESILRDNKITTVMHFGAKALVEESMKNPSLYYDANVAGTLKLLEAMKNVGTKTIIFSSSCATFGQHDKMINEDMRQEPINPYGRSKLFVEQILKDFEKAYGMRFAILRYFNAAGADLENQLGEDHSPETHLIPNALRSVFDHNKKLTVYGNDYPTHDGSCVRDYVHVHDLADAHFRAMNYIRSENTSLEINLGSGSGYSILEVLSSISRVLGKQVLFENGPRRPGDPPFLVADSSKAKKILDWESALDLDTIVTTSYNWMRSHPEGYRSNFNG